MKPAKLLFIYAAEDEALAEALAWELHLQGVDVSLYSSGISENSFEDSVKLAEYAIVLLSVYSVKFIDLVKIINFSLSQKKRVIPVLISECDVPFAIRELPLVDYTEDNRLGIQRLLAQVEILDIIKKDGGVVNPDKSFGTGEVLTGGGIPSTEIQPRSDSVIAGYISRRGTRYRVGGMSDLNTSKPAALQNQATSLKGKVLYDIPDNMIVNSQYKCVVRIGENEKIVIDDDTFTPSAKIESIPIAGVMKVELIDIAEPAHFNIKTFSSGEQEVESESYTEWLFWVTPLTFGMFSLILKISVIKIIDGKERRKDIVFEKAVNITAQEQAPVAVTGIMGEPLKNVLDEKNVSITSPPVAFISYAHKDKVYFDIFVDYLKTQSGWEIWTDRNIEIGSGWYKQIQQSINDTDIAVLLVSAYFIDSAFIKEHEFNSFDKLKQQKPGFTFVPVLLRDVDFNRWENLSKMQFFVAYGDEYGIPDKKGQMVPFAKLCRFSNDGQLIPNDNIDTYFKNLVFHAEKDWLKAKRDMRFK